MHGLLEIDRGRGGAPQPMKGGSGYLQNHVAGAQKKRRAEKRVGDRNDLSSGYEVRVGAPTGFREDTDRASGRKTNRREGSCGEGKGKGGGKNAFSKRPQVRLGAPSLRERIGKKGR